MNQLDYTQLIVLKELREAVGLTQRKAVKFFGLTNRTTIGEWENGKRQPPTRHRARFIIYLLDKLLLRRRPQQFLDVWKNVMVNQWEWKPLLSSELPPSFASLMEVDDEETVIDTVMWSYRPNQLPRTLETVIIGREVELRRIQETLHNGQRTCALVGMGGVGKSTLALHIATQIAHEFIDGVLFARVNGEESLLGILGTFCEAFGRNVSNYGSVGDRSRIFREIVNGKNVLIVLDNIEHATELAPLLPASTSCAVLITTRNHACARGQAIPAVTIGLFNEEQSLLLLRQYIGEQTGTDLPAVKNILKLTAGLPLAIDIVGSMIQGTEYLTVAEVAESLQDETMRLDELTDLNDETISVRASLEWSYRRLSESLKIMLAHLAIFDGLDFAAAAVAAVAGKSVGWIKRRLDALVKLSLLQVSYSAENIPITIDESHNLRERYQLHALVQLFAREKQASLGLNSRLAATTYFVDLTQQYAIHGYRWIDLDWGNIITALRWAHQAGEITLFMRGIQALTQTQLGTVGYLDRRGQWAEAARLLTWLDAFWQSADSIQAETWYKQGVFAFRLIENEQAVAHWERALNLLNTLPHSETNALLIAQLHETWSRLVQVDEERLETSLTLLNEAIAALNGFDSPAIQMQKGYLYVRRGTAWARTGDPKQGERDILAGKELLPNVPNAASISASIVLGNLAYYRQSYDSAETEWLTAYEMANALGDARLVADTCQNLATLAGTLGDYEAANRWLKQAGAHYKQIGDHRGESRLLSNKAVDELYFGQFADALDLLNQAAQIASAYDLPEEKLFAVVNRARCHTYLAELSAAKDDLATARQLNTNQRLSHWQAMILQISAEIAHITGDSIAAEKLIEEAIDLGLDQSDLGTAQRLRGNCLAARGKLDDAAAAYAEAVQLLENVNPYELAHTYFCTAKLHISNPLSARKELNAAIKLCKTYRFERTSLDDMIEEAVAQASRV